MDPAPAPAPAREQEEVVAVDEEEDKCWLAGDAVCWSTVEEAGMFCRVGDPAGCWNVGETGTTDVERASVERKPSRIGAGRAMDVEKASEENKQSLTAGEMATNAEESNGGRRLSPTAVRARVGALVWAAAAEES